MRTILRRVVFAVVLLTVLLGAALLSIRTYGEQRLETLKAEFVATVSPLPDLEMSVDDWQEQASRVADDVLPILRDGRETRQAAISALAAGEQQLALTHLEELALLRDRMLASHELMEQIAGTALGTQSLEVAEAMLERDPTLAATIFVHVSEPSLDGWCRTLSREAGMSLRWSATAEMHGIDHLYFSLTRPYEAAGVLSLYLAMHEALVQNVDDVEGHIRQSVDDSRPGFWPSPVAAFLVPNLVDMVEKRRAYLDDLERLRSRLGSPRPTT